MKKLKAAFPQAKVNTKILKVSRRQIQKHHNGNTHDPFKM